MTTRNKVLLFSSVMLALLVIGSVIIWQISSGNQSDGEKTPGIVVITIIVISVLSVLVVYFSKIQKRKYEKLLNAEYYEQYEIIKDAVIASQLSAVTRKDIIEDVLELLLTAQESGKPVRSVVGNTDLFVKNIIHAFGQPLRLALLNLYDAFVAFFLMVVGVTFVLWLEQTQQNFFAIRVDNSMVILFFLVSFLLVPVTKAGSGTRNPWIFLVPIAGGVAFVLLAELLRAFFYDVPAVQQILDGSIRMVPNGMILAIYLLSVPLFLVLKQISRKQLLRG